MRINHYSERVDAGRCGTPVYKEKKRERAQNQVKVYKNTVNFTRLFSVVCHRHQIKYLLFEWNFKDG